MAVSFGAECTTELSRDVTHLVTQKRGTKKCLDAAAIPGVKIVRLDWLLDCMYDWEPKAEEPYLLYPVAEGD
jgi:RNA polymerase II subunit A-like phosphatase